MNYDDEMLALNDSLRLWTARRDEELQTFYSGRYADSFARYELCAKTVTQIEIALKGLATINRH